MKRSLIEFHHAEGVRFGSDLPERETAGRDTFRMDITCVYPAPRVRGQRDAGLFHLLGQQRRPRPQRLSWRESVNKHFCVDPMIDSFSQEMHWV